MSAEPLTMAYDKERWMRSLEMMSIALGKEGSAIKLCLIGSAACLLGNMPGRVSRDLDIWKSSSDYDTLELKAATEAAGLLFNPKEFLEPESPYLQIVEAGIVQVGEFTPVLMEKMGRLELYRPPFENIIASKLARAAEKDIEDILYLIKAYHPNIPAIKQIIDAFPSHTKERCLENLVFLDATL